MQSCLTTSRLVRLLGQAAGVSGEPPRQDVAERLGRWVGAFDALALQSVQQAMGAVQARAAVAGPAVLPALAAQLQALREALDRAITQADVGEDDDPLLRLQARRRQVAPAAPGYLAFRQRHAELQQLMASRIGPVRAQVRQAISRASARLHQLALLDEALERMLAEREHKLLAGAGALLERRCVQMRAAHPDDWRERFEPVWRQALQAELEVRLEPVVGLVEAFDSEFRKDR